MADKVCNFKWNDVEDIVDALEEEYPDVDVQWVRFTDLHKYICSLKGFSDKPELSNEPILERIQMEWLELREDNI